MKGKSAPSSSVETRLCDRVIINFNHKWLGKPGVKDITAAAHVYVRRHASRP